MDLWRMMTLLLQLGTENADGSFTHFVWLLPLRRRQREHLNAFPFLHRVCVCLCRLTDFIYSAVEFPSSSAGSLQLSTLTTMAVESKRHSES